MTDLYSQAQNTGAEFVLQPDWLQHVSDELQLNTQTHTDTHLSTWAAYARLGSNEMKLGWLASLETCAQSGVFYLKTVSTCFSAVTTVMFASWKFTFVLWSVSSLLPFLSYFPFSSRVNKCNPGAPGCEHMLHTRPYYFATRLGSYERTRPVLNVSARAERSTGFFPQVTTLPPLVQ